MIQEFESSLVINSYSSYLMKHVSHNFKKIRNQYLLRSKYTSNKIIVEWILENIKQAEDIEESSDLFHLPFSRRIKSIYFKKNLEEVGNDDNVRFILCYLLKQDKQMKKSQIEKMLNVINLTDDTDIETNIKNYYNKIKALTKNENKSIYI